MKARWPALPKLYLVWFNLESTPKFWSKKQYLPISLIKHIPNEGVIFEPSRDFPFSLIQFRTILENRRLIRNPSAYFRSPRSAQKVCIAVSCVNFISNSLDPYLPLVPVKSHGTIGIRKQLLRLFTVIVCEEGKTRRIELLQKHYSTGRTIIHTCRKGECIGFRHIIFSLIVPLLWG